MMDTEAAPSRLGPIGNIYRSTYRKANSACHDAKSATGLKSESGVQRSFSLNPPSSDRKNQSDDVSNMTIEFLRARLLAERSTARSAKLQIDELEQKVAELERSLEIEVEKRKNAEAALQESLEKILDTSSANGGSVSAESEFESFSRTEPENLDEKTDIYLNLEDDDHSDLLHNTAVQEDHTESSLAIEPSTEMLEPHLHSDSDWATDNEGDGKELPSSALAARDEELDSDSDGSSILLPRRLGHAGSIGTSLESLSKSRNGDEWVRHVVDMLEKEEETDSQACEQASVESPSCETSVPYVSFAKYLGLRNSLQEQGDNGTTTWRFVDERRDVAPGLESTNEEEKKSKTQEQTQVPVQEPENTNDDITSSAGGKALSGLSEKNSISVSSSLRDRVFSSEEERVDEIFRVLKAARTQLKKSIERRQLIEKELFSDRKQ